MRKSEKKHSRAGTIEKVKRDKKQKVASIEPSTFEPQKSKSEQSRAGKAKLKAEQRFHH